MNIPTMNVAPRRVTSPEGDLVEPLEGVLFSTVGLASGVLPQDVTFFNYGIGDPIAGSGNLVTNETAKAWHTNLDKGGLLSPPKSFLVTGLRFYMLPVTFGTAAAGASVVLADTGFSAAALADSDNLEDMRTIFESAHCQFMVGTKRYVDEPLFGLPGNIGIGGVAAVSMFSNAGSHHLDVCLPRWEGTPREFLTYPIRIPQQQAFSCTLAFRWSTPPSLNDHRALVGILDGKIAREVQ
jgi:hypothetical protein